MLKILNLVTANLIAKFYNHLVIYYTRNKPPPAPPHATILLPQKTNNHKTFKNLLKGQFTGCGRRRENDQLKILDVQNRPNKKYNWHLYIKVRFSIKSHKKRVIFKSNTAEFYI